jgi:hypothetical protein
MIYCCTAALSATKDQRFDEPHQMLHAHTDLQDETLAPSKYHHKTAPAAKLHNRILKLQSLQFVYPVTTTKETTPKRLTAPDEP